MHIYLTAPDASASDDYQFHETLASAQAHLKATVPGVFRRGAVVYLLDVPTDKVALVTLLNDPQQLRDSLGFRIGAWRMTARGGLNKDLTD